jgi:YHS domain-containing protein
MRKSQSILARDGIALLGYDPISYFDGQPQKGTPDYRVESMGLTWLFANQRHADQFRGSPHKFVPQYEGHCSLAMSLNELVPGSPESWSINDGKLYFHNSGVTSLLFKVIPERVSSADANWAELGKTVAS